MSALADAFNETSRKVTATFGEDEAQRRYDGASDLAIDMIVAMLTDAGQTDRVDSETLDDLGDPVSDDLHTLLIAVLLRSERLADILHKAINNA